MITSETKKENVRKLYEKSAITTSILKEILEGANVSSLCKKYNIGYIEMMSYLNYGPIHKVLQDTYKTDIDLNKVICSPGERLWYDLIDSDLIYAPGDVDKTIEFIMNKVLTEREKVCLHKFYWEDCSINEISEYFSVSNERIRQIINKAMRKLKKSRYLPFLRKGYNSIQIERKEKVLEAQRKITEDYNSIIDKLVCSEKLLKKLKNEDVVKELSSNEVLSWGIERLDFSTRVYTCLKRANCNIVRDITKKSLEDLINIRNLGRRGIDEIIEKLAKYDIKLNEI